MRRALPLIALCGGLAAPSLAAGAPESFLLRVTTTVYAASICDRSKAEALIFRDNLVVESARSERGTLRFMRGRASAEAAAGLRRAMQRSRIGFETGGCHGAPAVPGQVAGYDVDWFGEGGRRNSFTVNPDGVGPACSEETAELVDAIRGFIELARAAPGAQKAELTVPPFPFCGP